MVLANKLPKTDWKRYQTFSKDISLQSEAWIQLILPNKPMVVQKEKGGSDKPTAAAQGAATAGTDRVAVQGLPLDGSHTNSAAASEGASVEELLQSASEQMKSGDWSGAVATLDKAKAKNPAAAGLWVRYGWVASFHRNDREAAADYKKELAINPDNRSAVGALVLAESTSGDLAAGRKALEIFVERHPDDVQFSLYLAGMQSAAEDNDGALKTLEAAARATPGNHMILARESDILRRLDRKDEAAAAAKSALDGTDDMEAINDAAYVLAEIGTDLPYAEEASRKGTAALEAKTATITPAEANSNAFAQSNLLCASWDTLGWVLFREGKLEQAEPLLLAGWRNSLIPQRGNHLGQLYEAMGKKQEALATYRLAAASIEDNARPDVVEHITKSIARLGGGNTTGSGYAGKQALQNTRTYHVARPTGTSGWGTFRVQIDTKGVIASQQMSGDQKLSAVAEKINAMKFPELVPPGSAAHLLRSAVVSCSMGASCDLVLVPNSSLQTEQ